MKRTIVCAVEQGWKGDKGMTEYIRRQDAVERMVDVIINEFDVGATYAYTLAEDGLNLPSADVVPVVHSRWIKTADGAECEKCGREAVYQIVDDHWEYEPWCPHCGSKMDEAEEDNG